MDDEHLFGTQLIKKEEGIMSQIGVIPSLPDLLQLPDPFSLPDPATIPSYSYDHLRHIDNPRAPRVDSALTAYGTSLCLDDEEDWLMPATKKCKSEPWPSLDGATPPDIFKIEKTPAPLPFEDFSCPQLTERAQATEPASVTAAARRATHPAPLSHSVALPPVPNGQITYACCERPSQRGSRKHGYQLHVHGDTAKYSPKWITRHAFTMYELANICDTQVPADRCEIANEWYKERRSIAKNYRSRKRRSP